MTTTPDTPAETEADLYECPKCHYQWKEIGATSDTLCPKCQHQICLPVDLNRSDTPACCGGTGWIRPGQNCPEHYRDPTKATAPTPERVGELLVLSQGAVEAFGSDYTVGITAGGLASLCRSWLALRAEFRRIVDVLKVRHGPQWGPALEMEALLDAAPAEMRPLCQCGHDRERHGPVGMTACKACKCSFFRGVAAPAEE